MVRSVWPLVGDVGVDERWSRRGSGGGVGASVGGRRWLRRGWLPPGVTTMLVKWLTCEMKRCGRAPRA
jgi:hypothetical protein